MANAKPIGELEEFSKYGKHADIVRKMTDHDDPELCSKFYTYDSEYVMELCLDFFELLPRLKDITNTSLVFPVFIPLIHDETNTPEGKHAILIIKEESRYFVFDPNGKVINGVHNYLYYDLKTGKRFGSKELHDFIESEYGLKFMFPAGQGIQQLAKIPEGTGHINDGGYCMYFTREALEYLVSTKTKDPKIDLVDLARWITIKKNILGKDTPFSCSTIHTKSESMISSIFGSGTRRKTRKNRNKLYHNYTRKMNGLTN